MRTSHVNLRVPHLGSLAWVLGAAAALLGPIASPRPASAQRLAVVEGVEPTAAAPGDLVSVLGRYFPEAATMRLGTDALEVVERRPGRWVVRVPAGARTGRLFLAHGTTEVAGPELRILEAGAPPVVRRVEPPHGAPGEEVEIQGERFSARVAENRVRIGTLPMIVRAATPTALRVIVPKEAVSAPIEVEVLHGGRAATKEPFVVDAATAILGFEPAAGPGGSRVTLRGTGFSAQPAQNRVSLGAVRVVVVSATPTELVVTLPKAAAGGRFVVDVLRGGRAESADAFVVERPPTIKEFAPRGGLPGATVTLHGAGFGTDVRRVQVRLAGAPVKVRRVEDDLVEVELLDDARTGPFEVKVGDVAAVTLAVFQVGKKVVIDSVRPQSGPPGTRVVIAGAGFGAGAADNRVLLGGRPVRVVSAGDTGLVVEVPEAAVSGVFEVDVSGRGRTLAAQPFVVTRPPSIRGFSPSEGPPGTDVTLSGNHFGVTASVVEVALAGTSLEVRSVTDTELVVRVPEGAQDGRFLVRVKGQGAASTVGVFHVLARPKADAAPPPVAPTP